jgi:hypothetical protein
MQPITCDACRQPTPAHDVVNYGSMEGGYRQLCGRCFNEAAASRLGLQGFEHVVFEPVRMVDGRGAEHEFRFRTRLFGPAWRSTRSSCAMAARPGIEFQVIGEPDDDPLELLGKLIGKMRRALALTHLEDTDHGPQVNDRLMLRGTVDSDPDEDHRVPMVVIDGREISWDELGRMVAAFRGLAVQAGVSRPERRGLTRQIAGTRRVRSRMGAWERSAPICTKTTPTERPEVPET